ncbi:PKD domain-containing protein [Kibdelosporangium philippinense]|uniref:PKD domain-containing protein n=1 Tax=Kibdelosporangium philippinense TaxID=211113 RepID=A0ABS8ZU04_9PSEU|nr:PKD domain-containing protein [Kibdelosporangium philippinense]MCE7011220.1 PKD domain-containing protein [Kibdelosporangium philippinense]
MRSTAWGVSAALLVGAAVVFGADDGIPAQDVRLLSGAAWLSSAKVGQVTLLDGSTAEVAAQLQVASPGNVVDVVQTGSTAYAVDKTAGTIRRIDGATFELGTPEAPIPGSRTGLSAFAGKDVLYAFDSERGVLVDTDPRTIARKGREQTLAAQVGDGTATLDEAGRLWVLENSTGLLTRFDGQERTNTKITDPGENVVTVAAGGPVVVNVKGRKVITVDPVTGAADRTINLDLRADDTVEVSGSPHDPRVYIVASRGVVHICDLTAGSCEQVIPLTANSKLGPAVEAGKRVFVPDYTTGQVWIINLDSGSVVAKPQVLTPAGDFQLLARDGMVFFNDPESARAGVVQLDVTILKTAKYDEKNPNKGLTTPVAGQAGQVAPSATAHQPVPPSQSNQATSPRTTPSVTQQSSRPQQTQQSQQPPTSNQPEPPADQPPGSSSSTTPPPPTPDPLPSLRVTANPSAPVAGDPATFNVTASDGQQLSNIRWSFQGGGTKTGAPVQQTWTQEGQYLVSVQARIPDGRDTSGSVTVTVGAAPTISVSVTVAQGGRITGGPGNLASCSSGSRCTGEVDRRTNITFRQEPDSTHRIKQWRTPAECAGSTSATCTVRTNTHTGSISVANEFEVKPPPTKLTVRVTAATGSSGAVSVNGGGNNGRECSALSQTTTCTYTINNPDNDAVTLWGNPRPDSHFVGWSDGPCSGGNSGCSFNVFTDTSITARFAVGSANFIWLLPMLGLRIPQQRMTEKRQRKVGI